MSSERGSQTGYSKPRGMFKYILSDRQLNLIKVTNPSISPPDIVNKKHGMNNELVTSWVSKRLFYSTLMNSGWITRGWIKN